MAGLVKDTVTRMHRASAPTAIDADLESLWTDVARQTPVARACMANLVVFCEHRRGERVDFEAALTTVPLDEVVRRHPSRVVILHHSPRGTDAAAPIAAAVSVVTFGAESARYGVEEIALRSACAEASLPSIVRSLTRGDVPTSVWWTEDLSRTPPVDALLTMARQLVYDSRAWRDVRLGVRALAPCIEGRIVVDLADVNWRRLTAMRHALAHAAESVGAAGFRSDEIRITHRPGDGALAWLLAGWLASRLRNSGHGGFPVRVEERRRGDEVLELKIASREEALTATMTPQRVSVVMTGGAPPFHLAVRRESDADAIAEELTSLAADNALLDALAALSHHFAE